MLAHRLLFANHSLSHQPCEVGYDCPHFTDEASEAQAGKNFCVPLSWRVLQGQQYS